MDSKRLDKGPECWACRYASLEADEFVWVRNDDDSPKVGPRHRLHSFGRQAESLQCVEPFLGCSQGLGADKDGIDGVVSRCQVLKYLQEFPISRRSVAIVARSSQPLSRHQEDYNRCGPRSSILIHSATLASLNIYHILFSCVEKMRQ